MITKEDIQKRIKELEREHFRAIIAFQEYDSKLFIRPSKLNELDRAITDAHSRKCELERLLNKMQEP